MKCVIVDDNSVARCGLRRKIGQRTELVLTAELDSGASLTQWLEENDADLIFLDIEMPGINGIEVAKNLPDGCMVVFTTAYSEYAVESYETAATDYLLKPIDTESFNRAVDRALQQKALRDKARNMLFQPSGEFITVKSEGMYMRIRIDDILYIQGLKDYISIKLSDNRITTRVTMLTIEGMLPAQKFLRVNKSYIVNIEKITTFNSHDIFIGETSIPLGASYRRNALNELLK